MEQLQNVLEVIKKHHFWILACLILVMTLGIYTMATGKAKDAFKKRESKIDSALNGAKAVTNNPEQPNQEKIGNWEGILSRQRQGVLNGWEILYQKQEKEKQWPARLGKEFLEEIKKIGPEKEISVMYRALYQNRITEKGNLPDLFERVNYRRYETTEGVAPVVIPDRLGPGPLAGQNKGNPIGVVDWPVADRKIIVEKFNFPSLPSTFRVRLAQEDYWVYQALLDIIKATNGDAKTQSSAAVKAIDLLQIAEVAAATIQSDKGPELLAKGARNVGGKLPLNQNATSSSNYSDNSAGMDGTTELSEEEQELLKDRYVSEDLVPLPAGQHPYSEFKMMPVLMRLKIDQRKIPDLLVKCANSSLPVEVKRYRMNPDGVKATHSSTSRRPSRGIVGVGPNTKLSEEDPHIVSIELRGIIYLYNPPDKAAVATGTLAEQATGGTEALAAAEETAPEEGTAATTEPAVTADTPASPEPTTPTTPTGDMPGDF